jgi:hypothetical protein
MSEEETQLNNAIEEAQTEYALTQNVLALSAISTDSALEHTLQHQSVHYANDQQSDLDLSHITAVAVDFDQIDLQQLNRTYAHVLDHLRTSGGTLIIQNADDSDTMASLIGVGVSAELAYIEMPTSNKHGTIHVYDHPLISGESVEQIRLNDDEVEEISSIEKEVDYARDLLNEQAAISILSKLNNPYAVQTHALSSSNHQQGNTFRSFYVDFEAYQWDYFGFIAIFKPLGIDLSHMAGVANIDVNFWVYLIKAEGGERPGQYLVVESTGNTSVNGLLSNNGGNMVSDGNIGPFQDKIGVSVNVNGGGMSFYRSAPQTSNGSSSFETSTGLDIGADSSGVLSAGLSHGQSATIERPHFGVYSTINAEEINVEWQMQSTRGGSYDVNNPLTMADSWWGGLHGVYELAYGSFGVKSEHVYRSALGNTSNINIHLGAYQRLMNVSSKGYFFYQDSSWSSRTASYSVNLSLNFTYLQTGIADVNINW